MTKDNIFALSVFIAICVAFVAWGYSYVASENFLIFLVVAVFGIFMAFNIGGNDVANAFGTSVGSRVLTLKQALIIAAIFELSGAVFAGGEVTSTIRSGIIDFPTGSVSPMQLVAVMISALIAAGCWLFVATKKGLPVSTTHAIVGGIVGGGITMGYFTLGGGSQEAFGMVKWGKIGDIALSWVVSPLSGGVIAYFIYGYVKKFIVTPSLELGAQLEQMRAARKAYKAKMIEEITSKPQEEQLAELKAIVLSYEDSRYNHFKDTLKEMKEEEKRLEPLQHMKKHIPIIALISAIIITSSLLIKGLKNLHLGFSTFTTLWLLFAIGVVAYVVSLAVLNIMKKSVPQKQINRIFGWFQIFTASSFAFSHGANDIANAVGPFAAVLDVLKTGELHANSPIPTFAMVVFGVALVAGLWFLGKEVIGTVAHKLANIHPTTGFSAELAASSVILAATMLGLPISSTHVLIGAVLGIGLYNKDANWAMLKPIALAWVITLPVAILGSSVAYIAISKAMGL